MTTATKAPLEDRRALLAKLLQKQAEESSYPLSFAQQRLWFLAELLPGNPVYNVPLGYDLEGSLDREALQWSLNEITRRHEVLRTVFRQSDGEVRQVVQPHGEVELPLLDVSGRPEEVEQLSDEAARRTFDLRRGPLWRPMLLCRGKDQHRLLLTFHHIIFDGWSVGILLEELSALYCARIAGKASPLASLPIQYADYAHWQRQHLEGESLDRLLTYWRQQLAGAPTDSGLPANHRRSMERSYAGDVRGFSISSNTVAVLENIALQQGATLFMVLLAAFSAVLDRYSAAQECVIGTLIAHRQRAEIEPLIGFFTNTLVMRLDLAADPTFESLVQRVRDVSLAAYAHQDLPFELLVEALEPDRDLARNPLFQVLFSFREGEELGLRLPGLETTLRPGQTDTAKFDLTCSLSLRGDEVEGRLEYSTELFEGATIERLLSQLETLLEGAAARPHRRLSELPLLSREEMSLLLTTWNDTTTEWMPNVRLEGLITAQAEVAPQAVAVVHRGEHLTYGQLEEQANRLARALRRRGVAPEVPVGICLPRGLDLVVALLAVLKSGGAYVPLDPKYPRQRLAFILDDAAAPWVLSVAALAAPLIADGRQVLCLDTEAAALADEDGSVLEPWGDAANGAYLMYTSGSTGQPKGVWVSHRNVSNFFTAMDPVVGEADGVGVWLAVTSISFDISVLELLHTLSRGFKVVLQDDLATLADASTVGREAVARRMGFSLFYFGGDPRTAGEDRYRLLIEGARFADRHGFEAVWTPERHFHAFGGLFPNPAITSAAVAAVTERVKIRAGSVVLPLHDPIRMAEDWSVIDNISRGRAGVSLAPGWHANDFVLAPERYAQRKEKMLEGLEQVRALWRGEKVRRTSGAGSEVEIGIVPLPVQESIPVWLTSARNPETFRQAAQLGAGVLTHLLGQDIADVADKIALYRRSWKEHQSEGEGHVTLMLHTFVGADGAAARRLARGPLKEYLSTSFGLIQSLGVTTGVGTDFESLPAAELDALVDRAVDRFADSAALLGDAEDCVDMIDRLKAIGVDEVACLIDFGVEVDAVLHSLEELDRVRRLSEARRQGALRDDSVASQIGLHKVTHLQCTPSLAHLLLAEEANADSLRRLRRLFIGGEAFPEPLAVELAARLEGGGEVYNMYGPTETTIWSSTSNVTAALGKGDASPAGQAMAIGRPVANNRMVVVDPQLRLAPLGVIGELLIGGQGVARGYHRRPALTAERFVPDPWSELPGARLYRTGDLVRYRTDGVLEFHGRLDHQVKISGHRIELGEIEAVLNGQTQIAEAAVVVHRDGVGDARLVAYCTSAVGSPGVAAATGQANPTPEELKAQLRQILPQHMLPAIFLWLDRLPRTPNGKLDRKALPHPSLAGEAASKSVYAPPESAMEQQLAEIWRQVLQLETVGNDDNFFEIGGSSFLIVRVRSRLLEILDQPPTLVELFRYPTIRSLAKALEGDPEGVSASEQVEANVSKKRQALRRRGQRARQLKNL